jgi:hypothetical protein
VNFKYKFNHQDQGGFSMLCKEGHLLVKKKQTFNIPLDDVSIHLVTTKIQVSFLTQLQERKETAQGFHHEANGDFKTVTEFNGCDRRTMRMDQQH